jgi:hypothetical protein
MTDVYTPTANYRLVVAVDETDVRFAAHYGLKSDIAPYPKSAKLRHQATLFDHLVGAPEQGVWNGKSLKPHYVCKPAFCAAGTKTDLVG